MQYIIGVKVFRIARIGKLHRVTYIDEHLVKYMMQNSKKGLFPFGFRVAFLKINALGHLWREITLKRYPMPLQWIVLSIRCYVLDQIFSLLEE